MGIVDVQICHLNRLYFDRETRFSLVLLNSVCPYPYNLFSRPYLIIIGHTSMPIISWRLLYWPIRQLLFGIVFFSGCVTIVSIQWLILTINGRHTQEWLDDSKRWFIQLLTFCTCWFTSGTTLRLVFKDREAMARYYNAGQLQLPRRAIVIANHQMYTDWLYIWYLAYRNVGDMGAHIYIIMKESLKKLPILGYGMINYSFVFLARNWRRDAEKMACQFNETSKRDSFWMLIFPEGTNMSHNNRQKSHQWARKTNKPIWNGVLLPRVKGLQLAVKEMGNQVITLTMGYKGCSLDRMAQDVFNVVQLYIWGNQPPLVSILIDVQTIDREVEPWIESHWQEKENEMLHYYSNGDFDGVYVDVPLVVGDKLVHILLLGALLSSLFAIYYKYLVNV